MKTAFKMRSGNSPLYQDLGTDKPSSGKKAGTKAFEDILSGIKKPTKMAKIEPTGYNLPPTATTKQASTYVKPFIDPTIELSKKGPTNIEKIKSKVKDIKKMTVGDVVEKLNWPKRIKGKIEKGKLKRAKEYLKKHGK